MIFQFDYSTTENNSQLRNRKKYKNTTAMYLSNKMLINKTAAINQDSITFLISYLLVKVKSSAMITNI